MSEIAFFDTNILVCMFDAGAPSKQQKARELFQQKAGDGDAILSTQVLQEFYVAITRKLFVPVTEEIAEQAVRDLSVLPVVVADPSMILGAISRSRRRKLSFWDSLIIESAVVSGASLLLSEDLQHGFTANGLRIVNPFLA
jgi:predicted nucleic acid-binding protein